MPSVIKSRDAHSLKMRAQHLRVDPHLLILRQLPLLKLLYLNSTSKTLKNSIER